MHKIIAILLIIVGVIHLLPLSGVLGTEQLTSLYGLSLQESNISILMRHRAILFGVFGLFFIYSAFNKKYQPLAFIAGFISVLSFLFLAWSVGDYNAAIRKVVVADLVALACLLVALVLYLVQMRQQ